MHDDLVDFINANVSRRCLPHNAIAWLRHIAKDAKLGIF